MSKIKILGCFSHPYYEKEIVIVKDKKMSCLIVRSTFEFIDAMNAIGVFSTYHDQYFEINAVDSNSRNHFRDELNQLIKKLDYKWENEKVSFK